MSELLQEQVHNRIVEASQRFNEMCPSKDAKLAFDDLVAKLLEIPLKLHVEGQTVETKTKRVFIAMPHFGSVEIEPVLAALVTAVPIEMSRKVQITFRQLASSLLANGFNRLWADCLNDFEADYFLMLHADVIPIGHFALDLMNELEAGGYTAMHAVVAIKDHLGLTSTAIGTADPWGSVRKLSRFEASKLPDTFGVEDMLDAMGREETFARDRGPWCLMPNTGCLMIKLGSWAERFPGFCIIDRIVKAEFEIDETGRVKQAEYRFTEMDGVRTARPFRLYPQVAPEDWNFGRWCFANNLKVGGTKKVRTIHLGKAAYGSEDDRNIWLQDEGFMSLQKRHKVSDNGTPSVSAEVADHRIDPAADIDWFPKDVRGWLSREEGTALKKWAKGKKVLEIGAYCGRSTICMAQSAVSVHTIDPFDGRATPNPDGTYAEFLFNLRKYKVDTKVCPWTGTSATEIPKLEAKGAKFDLVFIDGAHDLESVRNDIKLALTVLDDDGLIAMHDFQRPIDPEVKVAVNEFLALGAQVVELICDPKSNSHAVLVRPLKKGG